MWKSISFALAAAALSNQALAVDCPDYPGTTHEDIVLKVEGRMNGDWRTVIRTVQKSIQRQKAQGQDTSEAQLYLEVLQCLRQAIQNGELEGTVAEARGKPREAGSVGAPAAPASEESDSAATGAATGTTAADEPSDTAATAESSEAAPAAEATASAGEPAAATGGLGTASAAPGTAESYTADGATGAAQAGQTAAPQVAAVPPAGGYAGQICAYFTRPLDETIDGVAYRNLYVEGAWSCHAGKMYACEGGLWADKGACEDYEDWQKWDSSVLEAR